MTFVPAVANVVVHCAEPDDNTAAPQPAMVVPSALKLIVPVGTTPVTFAVKVTVAPTLTGEAGR